MKYHVNSVGGNIEGFKIGLAKALQLTIESDSKELLIKVGQLANATGMMSDVLGDEFVKSLIKNKQKTLNIQNQMISIHLESDKSKRSNFRSGVSFAPWATTEALNSIISDHRTVMSVYVPWLDTELNDYTANHQDSVLV
ncbi:hypothetical protein [Pseudoalteromonas ruthenica]|uniref:hypothetical protein n=1 Tax=Pseudoalteromonas ruthenica TaxID=151081 RepID=UPI001246DD7F|nr:hypothetical protein [Pseudoalteromonas ruthenica]